MAAAGRRSIQNAPQQRQAAALAPDTRDGREAPAEGATGRQIELREVEKQRLRVEAAIPGTERNRR